MISQTREPSIAAALGQAFSPRVSFALIGDHDDGLSISQSMTEAGHRLMVFAGPEARHRELQSWGYSAESVKDVEEVLARPDIDLVIVADVLEHRSAVLRRAVQAEKHVLCVHPVDLLPDVGYEAAMIQSETRKVLLPLLTERFTTGVSRLQELCQNGDLGAIQFILHERTLPPLSPPSKGGDRGGSDAGRFWEASPLLSLWELLRALGGEVREVSGLASTDELHPNDPLTLTGRFERGYLFQVLLLPADQQDHRRLLIRGEHGEAELISTGNSVRLRSSRQKGTSDEQLATTNPWSCLAHVVSDALAGRPTELIWQDGTRCLELFEATRKSVARRRVVPMHYEEFTEESTFKSAMTSLGCGLVCVALMLYIASLWIPWAQYLVVPLLLLFLGMQFLRWLVPKNR